MNGDPTTTTELMALLGKYGTITHKDAERWFGVKPPPRPEQPKEKVRKLTAAQRREIERLFRETWGRAVGFACCLVGNYQLAQDIVSMSFTRLMENAHRYDLADVGPSLVFGYVRNTARSYFDPEWRQGVQSLDAPLGDDGGRLLDLHGDPSSPRPDHQAQRNEAWAKVRKVFDGLTDEQVHLLMLKLSALSKGDVLRMMDDPDSLRYYARSSRIYPRLGNSNRLMNLEGEHMDGSGDDVAA